MKRIVLPLLLPALTVVTILALGSSSARADDETDQTSIRVQAPLDAVDCTAMTVSVLGLTIDIQGASIDGGECDGTDEGDDDGDGSGDDVTAPDSNDDDAPCPLTCANLVVGQSVTVTLSSDATPLTATEVSQQQGGDDQGDDLQKDGNDQGGDDGPNIEIEAPVQAVDATAGTIQLLGLTVDVSQAEFEGADDEDDDGGQPADLSSVMVGQFVKVELTGSTAPFAATEVRIENFANQVEVEVEDAKGQPVGVIDLEVHVIEKVTVQGRTHRVQRVFHFHTTAGQGRFTLSGLPTGSARIQVSGHIGGAMNKGKSRVVVSANQKIQTNLRLKKSHS